MIATSGVISRGIASIVRVAISRPWVTVAAMAGFSLAGLWYAGNNLGINTDTANMIDSSLPWRQDFTAYREGFPARDQNIVAVVDGRNGEVSMSYARELARALEAEPELFPGIFLAGDGEFFEQNGLLYLPLEELEQLSDQLIEAQPLFGRLAEDVSAAGMLHVLGESIEQSDALSDGSADRIDLIFHEVADTLRAGVGDERRAIAWGGLIGTGRQPSARQLLLIRPTLDYSLMRPARQALERVHQIAAELRQDYGDRVRLRLTGTLAMEHEELTSVTTSASTAGLAALAMVVVVLFWALRSPVLLIIAVVVLFSGLSLTAAFAAATVGELNLLSVAFAVLYIGLGVDFILHVSLRLMEARAAGLDIDKALIETSRGVGGSLLICAVTTAAGFFAFIPTDFIGVSALGLISGGGMIISLIVSLTLLPALIKLLWRGEGRSTPRQSRIGAHALRRPLPAGWIVGFAGVVGLVSLFLLPGLEFDGNPIHLRDPDAESIQALEDLASESEAPLFNLVVLVSSTAAAETTAAALAALPSVERVQTVASSLVPSDQEDKLYEIEELDFFLGPTLAAFERAPPNPERLVTELTRLQESIGDLETPSPAQADFRTASMQWLARFGTMDEARSRNFALALESDLLGNLVEQVSLLASGLRAVAFDRDDLPAELRDRWVNESGQELVEVVPREDLNDNEAAERFVGEVRSVAPNATGLPVVYEEAAATVTRAFILALAYAFGIVSVLLLLFLRSVRDALLVLVPIVFAAVVTAGTSVLLGLPLNFANIIALPLLVGVGVDSGIHMVHRMRTEPPSDGNPLNTSTSRAVFLSALTTIASFGNLAFSTHLGMASMGQLLTLGMVVSLLAVLGLLPALMRLGKAR